MRIRFSPESEADLRSVFDYIAAESPRAAAAVVERILSAIETLPETPLKGRPGREDGTRELVVRRTSYVVVYRVAEPEIAIVRVFHGRQDWLAH